MARTIPQARTQARTRAGTEAGTESEHRRADAGRRFTRRHRSTLRQLDRRALERAGWRTTLELRENHARLADGQLVDVDRVWIAEAELDGVVICASARSESRAWSHVSAEAARLSRDALGDIRAAASA